MESSDILYDSHRQIGQKIRYFCNAGGLNWRRDMEGVDYIDVECKEKPGNIVDWEVYWPVCANSMYRSLISIIQ